MRQIKFGDIKRDNLQIDELLVDWTIQSNKSCHIVGILGVNLMGFPCRLDILRDICSKYQLKLIVDNCEAYGCQLFGKYSLEYADMEITSHYIAHIIQSCEQGTVSTENKRIKDILKSIRNHGREPDNLYFNHIRYGLNLKPTDLHSSIGLGQIGDFWKIFNIRKQILSTYRESVQSYEDKFYFIKDESWINSAPHAFSITLREKYANSNILQHITHGLEQHGIEWKRNFQNIPRSTAFSYLNDRQNYRNAEYVSNYGIHIGCPHLMSNDDINYVCSTLQSIFKTI